MDEHEMDVGWLELQRLAQAAEAIDIQEPEQYPFFFAT